MSASTTASRGAAAKRRGSAGNAAGTGAAEARQAIRLSFLIHDVSRMRRTAYDHLMRPLGITRAQWWVLAHLSRHDGMMQTDLADQLEVGKASLGSLIDRLAPAGRQLLKRMTATENLFNRRILGALSSADKTAMILMLSTVKDALLRQISDIDRGPEK
jgi:MarR family transcriptional regulator for hemolysin